MTDDANLPPPTNLVPNAPAILRVKSPTSKYDEVYVMGKIKQLVEPLDNEQLAAVTAWYLRKYGSV